MYDIHVYLDFNRGYLTATAKIDDSRYLTSVLAAAIGSFGLSDEITSNKAHLPPPF